MTAAKRRPKAKPAPKRAPAPAGAAGPPLVVNRARLLSILGISVRTFQDLESDGVVEALERGRGGRSSAYDLESTVRSYLAHLRGAQAGGIDERGARARRDIAQARLSELRERQAAGQLIPVDEVEATWAGHVQAVRSTLLALPGAWADRVARVRDPGTAQETLGLAVNEALRQLGRGGGNGSAAKPKSTRSRRPLRARA